MRTLLAGVLRKLLESPPHIWPEEMQDYHSIPGLADRIFGGVGGGGGGGGGAENRRMRGYPGGCAGAQEPPAKCPRCESTNTKFCYYNNYNLSQPRHFCKSCRRYWTKGGVLRNVPVGGGCRKSSSSSANSKRSSSSSSKKSSSKDRRRSPAAASRSSSDSSSLTAAAADASASVSASASASASTSASGAASASLFFPDPALFAPHNPNRSTDFDPEEELEPPAMIPGSDIFSETGTFTSLMTAAASGPSAFLGLNFSDPPPLLQFDVHQPHHHRNGTASHSFETHEIRMQGLTSGRIDQTVPIDLPPQQPHQQQQQDQFDGRMCAAGSNGGMEWPTGAEQLLFDFGGGVDPGSYWSQSQWSDADPASLYLP